MFSRESASAAAFLKMMFHRKKISPLYEVGDVSDFFRVSKRADAVLVIGDAALVNPWHQTFEHCIDLGQLWYDMTQLPFVFAVWVVRRSFAEKNPSRVSHIHGLLLDSKRQGDQHMEEIVEAGKNKLNLSSSVIREYFNLLHCDLDDKKKRAMRLFFDSLLDQGIIKERAEICFF